MVLLELLEQAELVEQVQPLVHLEPQENKEIYMLLHQQIPLL